VANADDRLVVAGILFKNGYAVMIGKERDAKKTVYFVEYWEEK